MRGRLGAIHPDSWRDAARLGLQSGTVGAGSYLAAEALGLDAFLVIMMAVTSLQRSVGGTMGEAWARLQAAVAGSGLGLLCLALLPEGWGTAAALAVSLFVVGAAASLRPAWALGVVPAVGLSLGDKGDLLGTAAETSLGIALGAGLGVLVSLLVWPDRAERRFERHYRRALRATGARLGDALEAAAEPGRPAEVPEHVEAWNGAVWLAAEALGAARFVDRAGMRRRLDALRRLQEAVVILERAAEAGGACGGEAEARALRAARQEAEGVLGALAEGRRPEAPGPAEPEVRGDLAFGLRELSRSLSALVEAQGGGRLPRAAS